MTTSAFLNGWTFSYGTSSSSPLYSTIPEVVSMSGLGQVNPLVDVTSFASSAREYIGGLADGQEVTMECIYLPDNTIQAAIRTGVINKTTANFKAVCLDATHSPNRTETFTMSVVMLGWVINPSYEDRQTITFTMKISGAITVA